MCGIARIVDLMGERSIDPALPRHMCDVIAHRGPDGSDFHFGNGVGLGRTKLSIIDLACGNQGRLNEDGNAVITFNGEAYDLLALRDKLLAAGHEFRTQSDTEVLVQGWEECGDSSVNGLNGMYSYVIWDEQKQCLFMARDRLGKLGVFDVERVDQLMTQHESGQRDHSTTLWSLLMFENTVGRILDAG